MKEKAVMSRSCVSGGTSRIDPQYPQMTRKNGNGSRSKRVMRRRSVSPVVEPSRIEETAAGELEDRDHLITRLLRIAAADADGVRRALKAALRGIPLTQDVADVIQSISKGPSGRITVRLIDPREARKILGLPPALRPPKLVVRL